MGYVDVAGIGHILADGRVLLDDVGFRVGDGAKAALVGANGAGKTTLLRLIAGDIGPQPGTIARVGGLGVMRQFIGSVRDAHDRAGLPGPARAPPRCATAWDDAAGAANSC